MMKKILLSTAGLTLGLAIALPVLASDGFSASSTRRGDDFDREHFATSTRMEIERDHESTTSTHDGLKESREMKKQKKMQKNACVKDASKTKETVKHQAEQTYEAAVKAAHDAYKTAVQSSKNLTDDQERSDARKTARQAERDAKKAARQTMQTAERAAEEAFRVARTTCQAVK